MTSDLLRLHITPFSADILPAILGGALQSARNISCHEIQTAPENNYGYLDLPKMEAEKVKKKLNGAILKGKKIKIEDAKPRKRKLEEVDAGSESKATEPRISKKKDEGKAAKKVLSGHELSPDRKIKRGWTDAQKEKTGKKSGKQSDRQKSKYTDNEELLFRTKVPANKSYNVSDKNKKKKGKKNRNVDVVHEFEKTTSQPSFIKQDESSGRGDLKYVDGQGWVDDDGTVVEAELSNVKTRRQGKKKSVHSDLPQSQLKDRAPNVDARDETAVQANASAVDHVPEEDYTPSSDSAEVQTSSSSSAPSTPGVDNDTTIEANETSRLHPLEALFKKPQKPASSQDIAKPSLELATSNFSFFGAGADEDLEDDLDVPGTPYSSQDTRNRGLRSAAPTPDTAHPSRFNSYGSSNMPGDEDNESSEGESGQAESSRQNKSSSQTRGKGEPSDFEKMFWEKRGDHNRAWKARRRTVLKEKRQRENKARRPKNW